MEQWRLSNIYKIGLGGCDVTRFTFAFLTAFIFLLKDADELLQGNRFSWIGIEKGSTSDICVSEGVPCLGERVQENEFEQKVRDLKSPVSHEIDPFAPAF